MSGATPCINGTADKCTNPRHDHFGQIDAAENGTGFDTGDDLLVCGDCHAPMHYDEGGGDYYHDDPSAPSCFLIRRETPSDDGPGSPCPHCDEAAVVDERGDCIHCGVARPRPTSTPF